MKRFKKFLLFSSLSLLSLSQVGLGHGIKGDGHDHTHAGDGKTAKLVTGQGDFIFSWDEKLTNSFPKEAKPHEPKMHGGFNEDPETGIVYTGIPGYGLCSISADLKTWTKLGTDDRLKGNVHGITFFVHKGQKRIALAQNSNQRVLVVDLQGNVLQELTKPKGDEFTFEPAKAFYSGPKSNFAVTDVTYLDGCLYAVTGYSKGDFVLRAEDRDGKFTWGPVAWGGKGNQPGQFLTAHGVTAYEGHIYVGNRAAQQVVKFTKDGKFLGIFSDIPKGSLICNVSALNDNFYLCPLKKVGKQSSAPIYVHSGDKLLSTVIPGDLNIPVLNNIHHAWPHEVTQADGSKQLYILAHGWNKGKYAVLKQK